MAQALKKKTWGTEVVKATISYSNNTYVTERTVYIDGNGKEFVRVNGCFVELDYYKKNPMFRFHGYYSVA